MDQGEVSQLRDAPEHMPPRMKRDLGCRIVQSQGSPEVGRSRWTAYKSVDGSPTPDLGCLLLSITGRARRILLFAKTGDCMSVLAQKRSN